MKTPGGKFCRS